MSMLYDSTLLYDQAGLAYNGFPTGIPGLPNVGVFLAFNASPYEPNPMWTDVTEYVRQIPSIRRARSDDWSTFTGTASLVLNNRDQRFNPFNTLSPYNGLLKPRMQIKIVAVAGENDYNLFRGYVAGWPVDWSEQGLDSTVSIECFDALSLMADTILNNDYSFPAIQALNPIYWFRGNDPELSTSFVNIGSRPFPATGPFIGASPASASLRISKRPNVSRGIPFAGNALYASTNYRTQSITGNSDTEISVATWFSLIDTSNTYSLGIFDVTLLAATAGAQVQTNGFIYAYSKRAGTLYETTSSIGGFANTEPHHVAVTCTGSTLKLYIDGRDVTGSVTSTFIGTTQAEQVRISNCAFQDCAVWNYALTADQVKNVYDVGNAVITESTTARLERLTNNLPFSPSAFSFPTAPAGTVATISVGDVNLANEFNLVKDSEGGELYVSKDGVVTFTARGSQFVGRSSTTQAVFKDDGTALDYANTFSLGFDADSVVNDIRYELTDDAFASAQDSVSINAYGRSSKTITSQLASVADAQDLANSKLVIFADPIPTVSPLEVGTTRSLTEWQTLLSLEVLDQIEVTRSSPVGSPFFERLLVNEIVHSISTEDWSMQITGSARYTGVLILDDAVLGLLDKFVLG